MGNRRNALGFIPNQPASRMEKHREQSRPLVGPHSHCGKASLRVQSSHCVNSFPFFCWPSSACPSPVRSLRSGLIRRVLCRSAAAEMEPITAFRIGRIHRPSSRIQFGAPIDKCPFCPGCLATAHPNLLAPGTSSAIFASPVSHLTETEQTEFRRCISRDRSHQKRGPPPAISL